MATVKLFQGKDRREITKMKKVMLALQARDITAADVTKRSQAISTRTPVLFPVDTPTNDAVTLITARLDSCLAMTKTV